VASIASLAAEFAGAAQLLTVYTVEAHAEDEWPIRSSRFNRRDGARCEEPVCVRQPSSDGERLALARGFVRDFAYPGAVLVDPVAQGSPFEAAYSPWPFRFYGVGWAGDAPTVQYVAHPRGCGYSLSQLRNWLLVATGRAGSVSEKRSAEQKAA
jgi:hypothetical protein